MIAYLHQNNVCASFSQRQCHGLANASGATCDKGSSSCKREKVHRVYISCGYVRRPATGRRPNYIGHICTPTPFPASEWGGKMEQSSLSLRMEWGLGLTRTELEGMAALKLILRKRNGCYRTMWTQK